MLTVNSWAHQGEYCAPWARSYSEQVSSSRTRLPTAGPGVRVGLSAAVGTALGLASGLTGGWLLLVLTLALAASLVWLRPPSLVVPAAATILVSVLVELVEPSWTNVAVGLVQGLAVAAGLLAPSLVVATVRQRAAYRQQGWWLARLQAREHDARVEQALVRERTTMAAEVHDGLGHRLTLIAVRAARLSLDPALDPALRSELEGIRAAAADASDELGATVRLLREPSERPGAERLDAPAGSSGLEGPLRRARSAGLVVHSTVPDGLEDVIGQHTRVALARTLQEGLTNAAKHAPGGAVTVTLARQQDEVVLQIRNPARAGTGGGGSGTGLLGLRHRIEMLGGRLSTEHGDDFAIVARLPFSARPEPEDLPRSVLLTAEHDMAEQERTRAVRAVVLVPSVLVVLAVLVATSFVVLTDLLSVLPPERFAALTIGQPRSVAEALLPPLEMLDAPRTRLPQPLDASCRHYTSAVALFERTDVFRVCFADDVVVALDTVPPS